MASHATSIDTRQQKSEQRDRTAAKKSTPISAPHGVALAIIALAFGGLFIGTGEFAAMSLLPALASGTGVSVPEAGGYVSAYALGVVVGGVLPRRPAPT